VKTRATNPTKPVAVVHYFTNAATPKNASSQNNSVTVGSIVQWAKTRRTAVNITATLDSAVIPEGVPAAAAEVDASAPLPGHGACHVGAGSVCHGLSTDLEEVVAAAAADRTLLDEVP